MKIFQDPDIQSQYFDLTLFKFFRSLINECGRNPPYKEALISFNSLEHTERQRLTVLEILESMASFAVYLPLCEDYFGPMGPRFD